jgi:glycosyltransferase involved in cell wall biosynthesis
MRHVSKRIIVGSKFTYEDMPDWAKGKCVYIPENGVDAACVARPGDRPPSSRPVRVAFVGRLVAYKGADLLVEAAKDLVRNGELELHIIGDGPERTALEAMAKRFAISHSVHFHGWLPHAATLEKLRTCDLLALPSVREFGGGVVIEAMALGVAPVVADYGGPSEVVIEKAGIKVPFHDAASLVDGFKNAFAAVLASPSILVSLGEAASAHALEFLTWDAKASQILSVYDEAMGDPGAR